MSTLSQAGIDSPIAPALHPLSVPRPNEVTADSTTAERPHDASGFFVPRPGVVLIRKDYQFAKRLLDVSVCLAIFPLVLAVIAFCGAMVWLDDRGPLFFVQSRTGRGGRRFKVYKLRTMVTNATELKEQYAHLNVLSGPDFKIKDDPRVTRAGRVIRKASLDELPQIFNVLMGNMSLVGPRPCSFDASTFALGQTERFEVLPGITGLAQVSGRSDIDFEDKLRFDVEYIQKRGFWFDVRIIFRTVGVLINGRGVC